jgi:hypothetical protein
MTTIPNDKRTRQLFLDAAIKRAQAKAREARLQVDAQSDDAEQAAAANALRSNGWVPGQRRADRVG